MLSTRIKSMIQETHAQLQNLEKMKQDLQDLKASVDLLVRKQLEADKKK